MIRTLLAAVLLVVLPPSLVVANASTWALRTVLDDEAFTTTVGRSLDAPSLERAIAARASQAVVSAIDAVEGRLRLVAIGVLGLTGSPSRDGIETALEARILGVLDDPAVEATRDHIVEQVHHALIGAVEGDDTAVAIRGDQVVVDLRPLVSVATEAIDPRLTEPVLANLPRGETRLVVAESDAFETASQALTLLEAMRILIPIVVLIVVLAIIGLAHRRTRALGIIGVAVMIAGMVSLAVAWAGGAAVAGATSDPTVDEIAHDVYDAFTSLLVGQSLLLVLGGALVAIITWIALRRRRRPASGPPQV